MWQKQKGALYQKFIFNDFQEAFSFMTKVAEAAENQNHHPKWLNSWNEVEIWLSSHDAGNKITDKDQDLASSIDVIYSEYYKK